jgi:CRP-like cAMP-binding protein
MIAIMSIRILSRLAAMASGRRRLDKGQQLFGRGDPVAALYIVEAGSVELVRHQEDGHALILQRTNEGSVLAEASIYAERYHCDGIAGSPSLLTEIPKLRLLEALRRDMGFAEDWAAYLAVQVQNARLRAELLSRKTVAARLDGWLAWHGGALPAKGAWKSLAAEIGVSPEALYRELGKRCLRS